MSDTFDHDSPSRKLIRPLRIRTGNQHNRTRPAPLDVAALLFLLCMQFGISLVMYRVPLLSYLSLTRGFGAGAILASTAYTAWLFRGRMCGAVAGLLMASSPQFTTAASVSWIPAIIMAGLLLSVCWRVTAPTDSGVSRLVPLLALPAVLLMLVEFKLSAHSTFNSTLSPIGLWPGLLWFLVPFLSEFFSKNTKAVRYLYVAALSFTMWVGSALIQLNPLISTVLVSPTLIVLIAIGVDKLIPMIAGENPRPILRYGLPAAAIGILCVYQLAQMHNSNCASSTNGTTLAVTAVPHSASPPLQRPAVTVAFPPAATFKKPADAPVTVAKHIAPVTHAGHVAPKPTHVVKATNKKKVSAPHAKVRPVKRFRIARYVRKNGRIVRRSKWAIQWQIHHPYR